MARRVSVEVVMDDASYLAGASNIVSTNTKVGASNLEVAKTFQVSADAQLAAAVKGSEALKANALSLRAGVSKLPVEQQAAATVAADAAMAKYNRSIGVTAASTTRFSGATKSAESDTKKFVRGTLAGSGALSGLGRSLAFASTGFIAFAVGAELIKGSISAAEDLEKAQNSLGVAIKHTGGNLKTLLPQYKATALAAERFGVDQSTATQGLARATVLTGNAASAQRAYQEALVISKATGKDFNAVLTATSKGQEGITTSLQRYGIELRKGTSGQTQFNFVMRRFGGQAKANTTSMEQLHAAFDNTLATIGTALLPEVNKLAESFANYLTKLNASGKLQKDVASGMHVIHDVATPLIKTMGLLARAVGGVAKEWDGLDKASKKGGVEGFLAGGLKYDAKFFFQPGFALSQLFGGGGGGSPAAQPLVKPSAFFPPNLTGRRSGGGSSSQGPFGSAQPVPVFKTFTDTMRNQLAQARAALTKGTADDVAAAKAEIAFIKREIAAGHLSGNSLLQALQAEASAVSTIQSAEAAAAQKRAARAQALKAKIQQQIENSIDPIKLEVNLSRAQAQGNKSATVKALKALREAARKALASGKLNLQQQKEAYDQITQLNQEIAAATKQAAKSVLGDFKELNTAKIADKVTGLTAAQRAQLRAALSQIGPHHTVPRSGVGAEGYQIGDNGRPVNVYLDGKKISKNTTRHQQRHRRRNTHQRRGPNAGD